jgi:predicted 3-demethylubiquinone-9 3-methyltransferase (glyoxalase superfamily)
MPAITPFLWFNDKAEAAANFYVSIFPNSKILSISRDGDAGPRCEGIGDDGYLRARRPAVHGAQRRSAL